MPLDAHAFDLPGKGSVAGGNGFRHAANRPGLLLDRLRKAQVQRVALCMPLGAH